MYGGVNVSWWLTSPVEDVYGISIIKVMIGSTCKSSLEKSHELAYCMIECR